MTTNMEKKGRFNSILKSSHIQILVGIIGIVTVVLDEIFLSVEHGMVVLSLWHIAQGSSTIVDSLERILKFKFSDVSKIFRRFKK